MRAWKNQLFDLLSNKRLSRMIGRGLEALQVQARALMEVHVCGGVSTYRLNLYTLRDNLETDFESLIKLFLALDYDWTSISPSVTQNFDDVGKPGTISYQKIFNSLCRLGNTA